ncbi:MAG: Gfo/Idh/MocA family oxidoreductase [Gemmatales bacterium]
MSSTSRRDFLSVCGAAAGAMMIPTGRTMADDTKSPNARPRVGCIGNGGMGRGDASAAKRYGDIVAVCDVDRGHAESANKDIAGGKAEIYEDYRKLLDRKDIDIVTVSTPDHWHTKITVDAMRSGKDVYCQKPLTLTIDEGKLLCQVTKQTGRVLQVGTQQRSEDNNMFLKAVAMVQGGRIGKVKRVTCAIGGGPKGGPFAKTKPPANFNWNVWLGQTPDVEFIKERGHGNFRWWYEYSGGKLTDWGAHHVDIAQWAIGMDQSGPVSIQVVSATHPLKMDKGMPTADDQYNTAMTFNIRCQFANGVEINIRDNAPDLGFDNGILFEGENGKFFVSRSKLTGEPVDELKKNPIEQAVLVKLRKGKRLDSHMGNFIECCRDRSVPVSDVWSHHRALTTCHLSNIAIRLGRDLKWNPSTEQIVGDAEANAWLGRKQRSGFETV